MINRVVLVGRMTRDPDLRRTANGNAVTSFTLALDRGFESQDGQTADFVPVVVWNKSAESVAQYCAKGSLVGVDGKLRSRSYDNQQGQKVFVVEVLADRVQFLETRAMREGQQQVPNSNFYQQPAQQPQSNFYEQRTMQMPYNQQPQQSSQFYDQHTVNPTNGPGYTIMDDDIGY